jgi:hypothetical protein
MYGHIIGFGLVEYETGFDTVIRIKWADGSEFNVHPNSIELI